ncbi:MAG: aldehyde dehydrogenase family protein [Elusimicrobiota bacterium]|jgi:glyceraldehyde-3-phosphate dehydrogenase (NADP+)
MDVSEKIKKLFPKPAAVPADAEPVSCCGAYEMGVCCLIDGKIVCWNGSAAEVRSPIYMEEDGKCERRLLGKTAHLDQAAALSALAAAVRAWDKGRGKWPTMKVPERLERLQFFAEKMRAVREQSVRLLMWEIGKTRSESEKEFDRTVKYILDTIEALKEIDRDSGRFSSNDGILAQIRRAPLGVVLCMGPFNYPLNETFTTLIPALVMGNTVVAKLPRFGMLCQAPLLACFAEAFPPGVVNIINGDGKEIVGPIMESGELAALAFIGSSRVANLLKKQHPRPNRLRCILGLDAKNPGIILKDADLDLAVSECLAGALGYNGQRCTALKILFVQRPVADAFLRKLTDAVDALPFGLPWEKGVKITPLPEPDKPARLTAWLSDAKAKGAGILNRYGGLVNRSFFFPAVVYPVKPEMELFTAEQFGPVVPVAAFDDVHEVFETAVASNYGQQASIFGRDPHIIGPLVDMFANQVCRVNLNAQCQRGPDAYPFAGRKDSAESTLSVSDALRCFSIRSMFAAPDTPGNKEFLRHLLSERASNFVNTDYIF